MCKEDVRLARAASSSQKYAAAMTALSMRLFTADPERYGLTAAFNNPPGAAASTSVMIAVKDGAGYIPLFVLSDEHQSGHVTLLDVGQIIQGEIWAVDGGTSPPTVLYAGDTTWKQKQETI